MTPPARRGSALILVGHGSHISPDSSAPVHDLAARIRALGAFDEVIAAFWKEEPALPEALDLVESDDVWIVPVFLAEGYFTRTVLPRELGLDGALTLRGTRRIRYCAPVGTHPSLADMILRRARETAPLDDAGRRAAALVVIGHGTERSRTSGDTVYALVERLRAGGDFGRIECGFLDEAPAIADVLDTVDAPHVVLVPFFVAEGWHTRTTIPDDLGLTGDLTVRDGQSIWYTPPVGTLPEMSDVVLAIARDAGAPLDRPATPADPSARTGAGPGEIALARSAFFDWVASAGEEGRAFLQIRLAHRGAGRFDVRHVDDRDTPSDRLRELHDPEAALEIGRFDAAGRYRPNRATADLPSGWLMRDLDAAALWTAVSRFYPGAVLHWHRARTAPLAATEYPRWAARQTGIYAALRDLPPERLPDAIAACCDARRCLRTRLWDADALHSGTTAADDLVPCLEPCTLFATDARELLTGSAHEH